ncbi:hypothetical protein EV701_101281 [Chthoniobacter flavus]|nr:hypothetical protein EV701_101281 [Chthoniobacter flavus]
MPRTHLEADAAIAYGIDETLPSRLASWQARGFIPHVMTGVSWGAYLDYLQGRYDGQKHDDEAQMDRDGKVVIHHGDIPYMSPSETYGRFLTRGVQRALDAGAVAIHLEEPEFWVRSGYEPNFCRQWQTYFGEPWQPPHSSPDAQYRASKLKYALYRRALSQVFSFVRDYSKKAGREIRCYVPTHSLINYAHWRIVSPESSLLEVGCDGYIAQVWTGTARTPNVYEGVEKSRTFETAFLEYGAMQNLVRASGRRVWYLNDPIEDNLTRSWDDYRANWESTLTASLLQPEVWRYEIMPWPERVFLGKDFMTGVEVRDKGRRTPIPAAYETELQAVIHALGEMKQPDAHWEQCGTRGVGVLVSDTMMFQRGEPSSSDAHLGSFYGLALPLLKHGVPVEPVQIESATQPKFLDAYRVLLLTYEGQKPPTPAFHEALAAWVKRGGVLVVVDDDTDPFNGVREWWNTAPNAFHTPREHLFQALGVDADAHGLQRVGDGLLVREAVSPAGLTYQKDGATQLRALVRQAAETAKIAWSETNVLVLRRGPFLIGAGLDESLPGPAPVLSGHFVDLFEAQLPIVLEVKLTPGRRALLLDLDAVKKSVPGPRVIAAAGRIREEGATPTAFRFHVEGVAETGGVALLLCKRAPKSVRLNGTAATESAFEFNDDILRIRFPNSPEGTQVEVNFQD